MPNWSNWERVSQGSDHIEATVGPGVYEVRHMVTGRVIAFGYAGNVAKTIGKLRFEGGFGPFAKLFGRPRLSFRLSDLEYRTCAAASRAEAKITSQRLLRLQRSVWRRHRDKGWAFGP
jgi:hypothetical protein